VQPRFWGVIYEVGASALPRMIFKDCKSLYIHLNVSSYASLDHLQVTSLAAVSDLMLNRQLFIKRAFTSTSCLKFARRHK
jgi:hypothetical protein